MVQQLQIQLAEAQASTFLKSVRAPHQSPIGTHGPSAPPEDINNGLIGAHYGAHHLASPRLEATSADMPPAGEHPLSAAAAAVVATGGAAAGAAGAEAGAELAHVTMSQLGALKQRLGFLEAQNATLRAAKAAAAAAAMTSVTGVGIGCARRAQSSSIQPGNPGNQPSPASSPKTPGEYFLHLNDRSACGRQRGLHPRLPLLSIWHGWIEVNN